MILQKEGDLYDIRPRWLRSWVDLQYVSIREALRASMPARPVRVLDVGAGRSPYRDLFTQATEWVTVDPHVEADFKRVEDIPSERRFDVILLVEVLEHVEAPEALLRSLARHLDDAGEIWISVPFAARVHRVPDDFQRWTPQGLERLLKGAGLAARSIEPRGSDLETIAAKVTLGLVRRKMAFLAPPVLLAGHLSRVAGWGNADDPLGYFAIACQSKSHSESGLRSERGSADSEIRKRPKQRRES